MTTPLNSKHLREVYQLPRETKEMIPPEMSDEDLYPPIGRWMIGMVAGCVAWSLII
jgi:hypothetical protein